MTDKKFNIRVYGIFIKDKNKILLCDEFRMGMRMTKFPGGGLENGEGTIECLKREMLEEAKAEINEVNHFYTTDFYQASYSFPDFQLFSIYYKAKILYPEKLTTVTKAFDYGEEKEGAICFRWLDLHELSEKDLTFPIDKKVISLLK